MFTSATMPEQADYLVDIQKTFGFSSQLDWTVLGFKEPSQYVPEIDLDYQFDPATTLALLAGFCHNRRVLIQGFHGTGKSTHIEQVAARLNWPCIRVNLDSHISRIDLLGKDTIILENGQPTTQFQEGILPFAIQHPVALVFDEYDAGRPDIMFVIQRILEVEGKLTLLDQNKVLTPHRYFRLFATTNTLGLGDETGLYQGTQQLNQGQLDRWHIISQLNYLDEKTEANIIAGKTKHLLSEQQQSLIPMIVALANLSREGFRQGLLSILMSPRTVLTLAQNLAIFNDIGYAFRISFYNRCLDAEKDLLNEYFQRCFNRELNKD